MLPLTLKQMYQFVETGAMTALGMVCPPEKFRFDELGTGVDIESHGYTVTNPYPLSSIPPTAVTLSATAPMLASGSPVVSPL